MQLHVNQTLWLQLAGVTGQARLACAVVAITNDRVTLRFEGRGLPPIGMEPGSRVTLHAMNEQGVHVATAQVALVATKPHPGVALRAPIVFTTTQNRKFVRVVVNLQVACSVRAARDAERVGAIDDRAKCCDLSAGGMRLETGLALSVGDELGLTMKLRHARTPSGELNLIGQVVRISPGATKPRPTFFAGVELIHANQREQDALVMLVFELERKRLA